MATKFNFEYEGQEEARLDQLITDFLASESEAEILSRSQVKRLIEDGQVRKNGKEISKAGTFVKQGDVLEFEIEERQSQIKPWDFPLDVIFEDEDLLVVNKPAGLVVHPGAGAKDETLLNALMAHLQKNEEELPRLGIVHRLDKDTTGLLMIAKNIQVLNQLSDALAKREVKRTYQCLVFTTPRAKRAVQINDSGTISTMIGRHDRDRRLMQVKLETGRRAVTNWTKLQEMPYATELEVELETGRTHQIRVHMEHIGCPIIGDLSYGDFSGLPNQLFLAARKFGRQALHARNLRFVHPITKTEMNFEAELPKDYLQLREAFTE